MASTSSRRRLSAKALQFTSARSRIAAVNERGRVTVRVVGGLLEVGSDEVDKQVLVGQRDPDLLDRDRTENGLRRGASSSSRPRLFAPGFRLLGARRA